MNYITSCPACETQFLLTKDDLKAHRGKVQCGQCHQVFNAKNRLIEVSDDIHSVDEYAAAEHNDDFEENTTSTEMADFDSETPTEQLEPSYVADDRPISAALNEVLETVPNLADLSTQNEADSNQELDDSYTANQATSQQISESIAEEDVDIDAVRAPIFIEDITADPKFQLNKPKRNIWLILALVLLLIAAILQSIYFLRSTIAVYYPQLKPHLEEACRHLNCTINLPQHLDLLTIDDSDMQESDDYQDVINFSSLLINNAPHAQAYPNIELTLTDTDDKPVLRKLVPPQDYLDSDDNIDDGMAANEEVRINLAINVQNLSVAGYRVLLTY